MKEKKSERNLVDFSVIEAASKGDITAINMVLNHYSAYISFLAIRWFYDENGYPRCYVDEEKRRMLEIKLITKILDFEVIQSA